MQFYVPEIGDNIILTKDWEFTLFPEARNNDLGAFHGHYITGGVDGWIDEKDVPHIRPADYKVDYPPMGSFRKLGWVSSSIDHDAYNKARNQAEKNNPEFVKYWADFEEWQEKCKQVYKQILQITIPKGTILKVDRIYVRKGAGDFSSITFFAKNLGEADVITGWAPSRTKVRKKKSLRFWAKLVDCNTIEFEPVAG